MPELRGGEGREGRQKGNLSGRTQVCFHTGKCKGVVYSSEQDLRKLEIGSGDQKLGVGIKFESHQHKDKS